MGQTLRSCVLRDHAVVDRERGAWLDLLEQRPPGARVVPYGVLGNSSIAPEVGAVAPEPDENMVFLDAAGLHHIQGSGPQGAHGASGAIYRWLGIDRDDAFHEEVVEAITEPLRAKYHAYGDRHCIHVVGADFRELSDANRQEAVELLTEVYGNALAEFCLTGKRSLRLLPVSGGIFSGAWGQNMGIFSHMTAEALERAFYFLPPESQLIIEASQLEMCIFMLDQVPHFERAFHPVDDRPDGKPRCSLSFLGRRGCGSGGGWRGRAAPPQPTPGATFVG